MKGYNVRKAAQVVAFFAKKEGGQINVLKLTKLLYLSDRKFLELYDCPILLDNLVSMNHGPVNSRTLDYINGVLEDVKWDEFIADRAAHNVGLCNENITVQLLDELSNAEIDVLEKTYAQFGKMNKYQLRDYTHKNCPEWENPSGSSAPIPYIRVFNCIGKKDSVMLAQAIEEEKVLRSSIDTL